MTVCPIFTVAYVCAGGSALGSAAVYDEVMCFRKEGMPIVVSMGNIAASGGYYIAGVHHRQICCLCQLWKQGRM